MVFNLFDLCVCVCVCVFFKFKKIYNKNNSEIDNISNQKKLLPFVVVVVVPFCSLIS